MFSFSTPYNSSITLPETSISFAICAVTKAVARFGSVQLLKSPRVRSKACRLTVCVQYFVVFIRGFGTLNLILTKSKHSGKQPVTGVSNLGKCVVQRIFELDGRSEHFSIAVRIMKDWWIGMNRTLKSYLPEKRWLILWASCSRSVVVNLKISASPGLALRSFMTITFKA